MRRAAPPDKADRLLDKLRWRARSMSHRLYAAVTVALAGLGGLHVVVGDRPRRAAERLEGGDMTSQGSCSGVLSAGWI